MKKNENQYHYSSILYKITRNEARFFVENENQFCEQNMTTKEASDGEAAGRLVTGSVSHLHCERLAVREVHRLNQWV
jgi:hypothetical protein